MNESTPYGLGVGVRLGPYQVLGPLGAGGMGEVYRARDERLGREVAVKVLPRAFSKDEGRLERFELEARAAGALNHPNLLTVFDVGSHDGARYIVCELLEGETLRDRLGPGPLPPRKALDYAVQIAQGLAAAHAKGIVHRDLKPENLFITKGGRAKVLDFGLAKLTAPEAGGFLEAATVSSPTAPGAILGTVGYMSPEQVQGLPADHRSDIFSFGAVLYEMVTGQRAFQGATAVETMNAILKSDPPDLTSGNALLPPMLERIVRRCLEKDPEERFRSAHDLAFALDAISTDLGRGAPASGRSGRARGPLFALGLALLLAAGFTTWLVLSRSAEPGIPSYRRLTFRRGTVSAARFTPDSSSVVYSAAWEGRPSRLFSTRPGSPESRPFDLPEAVLLGVSSSGEMAIKLRRRGLAIDTEGTLARVGLAAGAPREVADGVIEADWLPDGKELTAVTHADGKDRLEFPLGKVLYETTDAIVYPHVSPRGDQVAFFRSPPWSDVCVVDRSGHLRMLAKAGSFVSSLAWSPAGDEVWYVEGQRHQDVALRSVGLSGRRRLLARFPSGAQLADVARDGRALITVGDYQKAIVYAPAGGSGERDLSWLDASRARDISADGRLLLFHESGQGGGSSGAVYLRTTAGDATPVRLGEGFAVSLSPDTKWTLTMRDETRSQLILLPTGAGPSKVLQGGDVSFTNEGAWFADGKRLLVEGWSPGRPNRSYLVGLDGEAPRPITPEGVVARAVAPDGLWVAAIDADGRLALYPVGEGVARHVPGPLETGQLGRFSADGRSLYVSEFDGREARIFRRELESGRREPWKTIVPSDPAGLWLLEPIVAADGRSFVYTAHRSLSSLYLVEGLR